jgi:hypothetical protein
MRKETILVNGKEELVYSHLLELRPSGLPAKEYKLINGEYRIYHSEDVLVAAEDEIKKKSKRDIDVSELFVEHEGVSYHANERSQVRIATRLASVTDTTDIEWKSKDGWVVIKGAELKMILVKAANLTTKLWKMEAQ